MKKWIFIHSNLFSAIPTAKPNQTSNTATHRCVLTADIKVHRADRWEAMYLAQPGSGKAGNYYGK